MKIRKKQRIVSMLSIAVVAAVFLFGVESYSQAKEINSNANQKIKANISPRKSTRTTTTAIPRTSAPPTGANAFVTRVFTDSQGQSLRYYLYVPNGYTPGQSYPLVLLLHGGGERSNPAWTAMQNKAILFRNRYVQVWTPGYSIPYGPNIQQHWPSFVVVPQLSYGQYWVDAPIHNGSYTQTSQATPWLLRAKEIVDALQKEYQGIDSNRLYITGLSLGGYGVWDAIERWPSYFAAAIPIAGAGDPSKAAVLKNLPIWAFHGSADATVPVSGSRDMIAAIKAAGGHPLYTEYPGAGHGIWDSVYATTGTAQRTPGVLSWLFSQVGQHPL